MNNKDKNQNQKNNPEKTKHPKIKSIEELKRFNAEQLKKAKEFLKNPPKNEAPSNSNLENQNSEKIEVSSSVHNQNTNVQIQPSNRPNPANLFDDS